MGLAGPEHILPVVDGKQGELPSRQTGRSFESGFQAQAGWLKEELRALGSYYAADSVILHAVGVDRATSAE